ncbi:N-succinylarginine dihydrolase [Blastopirellula sp. JC732]|uniref:N-succinylarginine dihydrolase n=1 Tax=Blastopirellula sediminis TaxID=2894196 RepID=A0A9X1SEP1_9BACT|nr:N-succinylarginine dihydrolase [Blastopirellula sediminis]MCC9609163.1 N-succinylarginine dihydrolase [Blastopirellula sediminis]MCC9628060.1 N-succinylarginine dihydrolase [Blastopirellula sediminis]
MTVAGEVNFDGLLGPTHHFGGLSAGNIASLSHRHQTSSPRRAALEGLEKMRRVAELGVTQAIFPPQRRPHWEVLREQGFSGDRRALIEAVAEQRPELLSVAYSASAMWAANAATVSPSADTADGRVHLTPANLRTMPHRRIEAAQTTQLLREIFADERLFVVHDPLPDQAKFSDEGAANHTRLCNSHSQQGVEFFVYGRGGETEESDGRFPARQTRMAAEWITQQHQLWPERTVLAQQSRRAIDAGVFHNDVIAVGNESVHLVHEYAFADQIVTLKELEQKFDGELTTLVISDQELPLEEAVRTYFFNSQLLTIPDGTMTLVCPAECERSDAARKVIDRLLRDANPIQRCEFVDVRESMHNGGGPACLRLRVVLTPEELAAIPPVILWTPELHERLRNWIESYYRDELSIADLADPILADEAERALDELGRLLGNERLVA